MTANVDATGCSFTFNAISFFSAGSGVLVSSFIVISYNLAKY
jgi:hypothetical protein